jgi:8-oxo-dGTP diphosphatase
MPPDRYASIVDVHVILRRGGRILLLRRAGDTYASGQLCLTGVRAGSLAVAC